MSMFCGNCGARVNTNSDFCPNCGAQLIAPGQDAPMQQPSPPNGYTAADGWQAQSNDWEQQTGKSRATGGSGIGGYLAERQKYRDNAKQDRVRKMADGRERTQWGYNAAEEHYSEDRVFMGGQSRYTGLSRKDIERANSRNAPVTGMERYGVPQPGWSDRVNDPEIRAAINKNRSISRIAGIFIVPLPFIGFLIYGAVSDNMEMPTAIAGGIFVSIVFLIFYFIGMRQTSGKGNYEGIVVDKYEQEDAADSQDEEGGGYSTGRLYGVTVVRTTTGKQKKIKEPEGRAFAWDYLNIGDQFRYHADMPAFPYERYDKAKYPYLYCVCCRHKNPIEEDRCMKCGKPLLK